MKRDVLSGLMVAIGVLLCGTVPGVVLGAPMAAAGAYWFAEPRLGSGQDVFRRLARQTR
ncbi:hypothetical protein [Haladaptatus salinisoli]|uniref:hypothetical protein n=1 Tax=Haladaptatus salinisoli TaxID=2884876 RepID=UPI001D0AF12F|nr:hypothetical protein [Haladaptatus salinisoli]